MAYDISFEACGYAAAQFQRQGPYLSNSFFCKTCGDTHEGLPTDHGWTLPDVVWSIPEADRSSQAKFDADCCQLGDRFFIRGILKLPFNEQPGYYGWGVWVELSESSFYR